MANNIQQVIADVKRGKVFILVDEADRENEGDLIVAAELVTPEVINFMMTYGKGSICMTITEALQKSLNLDLLPKKNTGEHSANFAIPIDAIISKTGVSAYEKTESIKAALTGNENAICTPGHLNILVANPQGLKARRGHTEGSLEVMKVAGFSHQAAVICEIIREDGKMARMDDLEKFASEHRINILQITELIEYIEENGL